jgi:hypothetical protein
LPEQAKPARLEEILRQETSGGLEIGDDRNFAGEAVEDVEIEGDARLLRDGRQVKRRVR